jgi:fructose-specific phosphotransferase system IIC component
VSASQIAVPGAFAGPTIFAGAGRMGLVPGFVTGAAASAAGAGNLR